MCNVAMFAFYLLCFHVFAFSPSFSPFRGRNFAYAHAHLPFHMQLENQQKFFVQGRSNASSTLRGSPRLVDNKELPFVPNPALDAIMAEMGLSQSGFKLFPRLDRNGCAGVCCYDELDHCEHNAPLKCFPTCSKSHRPCYFRRSFFNDMF